MAVVAWIRERADVLLAVVLALLFVAETVLGGSTSDGGLTEATFPSGDLPTVVAGIAFTLSLRWRRSLPLAPLGLSFVGLALAGGASPDTSVAMLIALVATTYSVGAWSGGQSALIGALGVGALAGLVVLLDAGPDPEAGDIALGVLLVTGPWLAGLGARNLRGRAARLEAEAARHEHEREEQVRSAITEERARIARELHDVVAHAISIIVLQARGAQRNLPHEPAVASEALGVIEETGGQALGEMRRVVAVLRSREEPLLLTPRPGLDGLPQLLDQFRDAGLPVTLSIEGDPTELPPGLDLSAYRVIQESLTNTLHHAAHAKATVRLRYAPAEFLIEIEDDGRAETADSGAGAGMGLVGMQERVELYGGTFTAGSRRAGGYRVTARIPLERDP